MNVPKLNGKIQHPGVTWGVLLAIFTLATGGITTFNILENQVQANEGEIEHQKELRRAENERIKRDLQELKDDSKEIKKLINQLILK